MDKRPIGYKPGQKYFMDYKPKKNPKYENVKGKLNSGPTKDNVEVISDKTIAKRKSEVFTRITKRGLYDLITFEKPQESIYNITNEQDPFHPQNQDNISVKTSQTSKTIQTSKTMTYHKMEITEETDFLLIDIREPEDFSKFRIKEAINFPAPLISRDKFLPQIMKFKNQSNRWIVVYHYDEKHSMPAATALFEKGFDNLLMLSGGVEEFYKKYPELVEGDQLPEHLLVIAEQEEAQKGKTGNQQVFKKKNDGVSVNAKTTQSKNMTTGANVNKHINQAQKKAPKVVASKRDIKVDNNKPGNAWDEIPDSVSTGGGPQVKNKLARMASGASGSQAQDKENSEKVYVALPKKSQKEVTGKVTTSYLAPKQ